MRLGKIYWETVNLPQEVAGLNCINSAGGFDNDSELLILAILCSVDAV